MDYALSIKQPWATLLVHGRKTIEVRRWSTLRRGRVLIHAARIADDRPEAWAHITPALAPTTKLRGGIIGAAQLVGCTTYSSRAAFAKDRAQHLNEPDWFVAPALYGFVFENTLPLPFRRCTGSLHFFEVEAPAPVQAPSGLLVSVRSVEEARAALEGGADIIDVKEPRHGALGRAADSVLADVVTQVAGQRPVSAAWGELVDLDDAPLPDGVAFLKCGLAKLGRGGRWQRLLEALRSRAAPRAVVTVAYADWKRAGAPAWSEVAEVALSRPGVLLIDTFDKRSSRSGQPASLLDWVPLDEIQRLCRRAHAAGVRLALAGSLRVPQILQLLEARPTWFAVRGAVCDANDRDGAVHGLKVRSLSQLLRWKQQAAKFGS
jgi:(5-formylfuran-3-yl)methyl phosphate synthase